MSERKNVNGVEVEYTRLNDGKTALLNVAGATGSESPDHTALFATTRTEFNAIRQAFPQLGWRFDETRQAHFHSRLPAGPAEIPSHII